MAAQRRLTLTTWTSMNFATVFCSVRPARELEKVAEAISSRMASHGLWFMSSPPAVTPTGKPLSASLSETLGALFKTSPARNGTTNLYYGIARGRCASVPITTTAVGGAIFSLVAAKTLKGDGGPA
ncbi:TPA: hypothetical protein EYP38_04875 [Candidatus Micrarchaeota archaeon]|nr:hypothetical protein [Candidatus Micrarchaeota archaeon]